MAVKSKAEQIRRAMVRIEEAATQLMFYAERWTLTGRSFYDLKCDRKELLAAGRRYGRAIEALTRVRSR